MVDFVLVSLILVPLFAAILQLAIALHARNTMAACAQEGARYAAAADITVNGTSAIVEAATTRTKACVADSLSGSLAKDIVAGTPLVTDSFGSPLALVEVRVSSPFPVFGLFGVGPQVLHAKGDAMQESP